MDQTSVPARVTRPSVGASRPVASRFIVVFPLTFISSAFVPVESMPDGLRWFAEINPFTYMVDAMRALWLGAPAGNSIVGAILWTVAILAVFVPYAVYRYRRAAVS